MCVCVWCVCVCVCVGVGASMQHDVYQPCTVNLIPDNILPFLPALHLLGIAIVSSAIRLLRAEMLTENAVDSGNTPNSESSNQPGQHLTTGKLKKDEHPLVIMVQYK